MPAVGACYRVVAPKGSVRSGCTLRLSHSLGLGLVGLVTGTRDSAVQALLPWSKWSRIGEGELAPDHYAGAGTTPLLPSYQPKKEKTGIKGPRKKKEKPALGRREKELCITLTALHPISQLPPTTQAVATTHRIRSSQLRVAKPNP